MSVRWEDLDARVRGLALHLLDRDAMAELAAAPDPASLQRALERHGFLAAGDPADAASLELAIRRWAARPVAILQRWLDDREPLLRVVLEDEDRRSLRAIVRGAVAGAPPEQRLAGLIPTRSLPERVLEELARQADARAVAALLSSWHHPFGAPLLAAAAAGPEPDTFALELALDRTWAARATDGARRCRRMRRIAAGAIDLRNARAAVTLAAEPQDQPVEAALLPGGRRVDRAHFVAAAQADGAAAAAALLAEALGSRTLAVVLRRHASEPGRLDDAILSWRIGRLARRIRLDPLGPEPVIHFLLRLRRQVVALRRVVWSAALGAPSAPSHLVEAV